jgi:uncharacterized membrane protein
MKNVKKKATKLLANFFKDKWNIAIALLILVVFILGIVVVGTIKTIMIMGLVIVLVLLVRFGGTFIMSRKRKERNTEKRHTKKWRKTINAVIIAILSVGIICVLGGIAFLSYIVISAPKFDKNQLYYKEASILYDIITKR